MRKSSQIFVLVLLAIAHSFAFLYAWAYFGATALFSVGAATNSYFMSVLAGTLVSATVVTLPLALLAGYIAGRKMLVFTILLFVFGWLVFNLSVSGFASMAINSTHYSLPVELIAMTLFSFLFYKLGARLGPNYALKGTSV